VHPTHRSKVRVMHLFNHTLLSGQAIID